MRVLIVEDEPKMAGLVRRGLLEEGHVADVAAKGEDAIWMAEAHPYDAIVLDVMLPGLTGFETCRRLRNAGVWTPVLMLTARDAVEDRVSGLDAGADDYLTKPFAYEELAARLRALGRRSSAAAMPDSARLTNGPIVLDEARRRVTVAGDAVELTAREFSLLECLLRHPGQALSRDQLLDQAWPLGVAVTPNTVDAFMTFLRRKLGPAGADRIATVRGIGYRMLEQ